MATYLGMDLAWGPRARTGLAALDGSGRLVASASVRTDDEIAAFVAAHTSGETVAAVDAPLIVLNRTGRRPCEALVSAEFGPYDAGAYPANRSNPHFDPPRAETLAERFGWATDPGVMPGAGSSVAIEVYPHPAMVTLFGLPSVLPYKDKAGRDLESLRAAFVRLVGHLERVCEEPLELSRSARWRELVNVVSSASRKSELGLIEDEIDAILCAYLAWLWGRRDPRMRVLGDAATGYIVVPGLPTVAPARVRRGVRVAAGRELGGAKQPGAVPEREYAVRGAVVREHRVTVPVDWSAPDRYPPIEVFAREVVDPARSGEDLPLLLFLQGGPGGQGPRPTSSGWWTTALKTHRVVLLDQRGTGRSSRIHGRRISTFDDGQAAADYLACFRADAIVEDAEHLRRTVYGGQQWATLGQSYGGFLTLTYLSRHPEALTTCYVTGGLPGLTATAEDVYRRTYPRQVARNRDLARRYPQDVDLLGRLADRLAAERVVLPDGDLFTVERLQMLGQSFGMSTGVDGVHWLLDTGFDDEATGEPSDAFLAAVAHETGADSNPLYAVLQEVIYHQGSRDGGWAAQAEHDRWPPFGTGARPLLLTGEAIFPWMYRQIRALRPFEAAVEALAARTDWPELYDAGRLASNDVPVAAVQYLDDPYVDVDLALETAAAVGNTQVWVTNEYLHDGLRVAGDVILPRLMDLANGTRSVTGR